jgi:hypothetical protein
MGAGVMTAATATHTCPHCGMTTAHPNHVQNRYCERCHHFCDAVGVAGRVAEVVSAGRRVRDLVRDQPINAPAVPHGVRAMSSFTPDQFAELVAAVDDLVAAVDRLDGRGGPS